MNDAFSSVCAGGHVESDDLSDEPASESNGKRRCGESGCTELVFTHCPTCGLAIPGYIDGVRYVHHGNLSVPKGHISPIGGPQRSWREDCPQCKAPYPWATDRTLVEFHRRYLKDRDDPELALPLHPGAATAFERHEARRAADIQQTRRADRRARRTKVSSSLLDTWPKRVKAIASAIGAVLLLFGVKNLTELVGDDKPPTSTTTSTAPPNQSSTTTP